MATTKLYLHASGTPPVSPAFQSYTHAMVTRHPMGLSGVFASTLANIAVAPDAADHLAAGTVGIRQFVSPPMIAGITFSSGGSFKYAVQCFEDNAANNLQVQFWAGVYSYDGTSLAATLRSAQAEGNEINTTLRNVAQSSTMSAGHTTTRGQRLVVEFAFTGTPSASGGVQGHNGSMRFGSSGAGGDLPENDTETGTTLNPWVEFTTDIAIGFIRETKDFQLLQALRRSYNF